MALLLLPLLYVLGIGPMVCIAQHTGRGENSPRQFYIPVVWLHDNTPLKQLLERYAELWG